MLRYALIPVTPFQQNCTVWWCESSAQAALIDPGGEAEKILGFIKKEALTPKMILLTHGHIDHIGAALELSEHLNIPILGPQEEDRFWFEALPQQCQMFGFPPMDAFTPQRWLYDGESIELGKLRLEVRHCPGHTPGHVIFFEPGSRLAQVGDVLFKGSIGRTDFPRGDLDTLLRSIREQLWSLGDDTQFVPGHGPMSSIAEERRSNPFLQ